MKAKTKDRRKPAVQGSGTTSAKSRVSNWEMFLNAFSLRFWYLTKAPITAWIIAIVILDIHQQVFRERDR